MTIEEKFKDVFKSMSVEDIEAFMSAEPRKRTMFRATDADVISRLRSFGVFPTTEFKRVGDNVVIADNCIVVILKFDAKKSQSIYLIDEGELPLEDETLEEIEWKTWATPQVIDDIRKAEKILLK